MANEITHSTNDDIASQRTERQDKLNPLHPATWGDRAMVVSFGLVFGSIPFIFSLIAASNAGDQLLPWPFFLMFCGFGLVFVIGGFSPSLKIRKYK